MSACNWSGKGSLEASQPKSFPLFGPIFTRIFNLMFDIPTFQRP